MLTRAIEATKYFFEQTFGSPVEVVGIVYNNEGFEVTVEMLNDGEYTKKRIRNDLIAVYKVLVSERYEVLSFTREEIRERGKALDKADS